MNFLKKWVYGEFSLAKTYWLFGVLGQVVMYGITILAVQLTAPLLISNSVLGHAIMQGVSYFWVLYATLAGVAIINSAGYSGKRSGWGWAATILAVLGLLRTALVALQLAGLMPTNFDDVSKGIAIDNMALPVRIDEATTLERIDTHYDSKSLIYRYSLDDNIQDENFFRQYMKKALIGNCEKLADFFSSGVQQVVMSYKEPNLNNTDIILFKRDCK